MTQYYNKIFKIKLIKQYIYIPDKFPSVKSALYTWIAIKQWSYYWACYEVLVLASTGCGIYYKIEVSVTVLPCLLLCFPACYCAFLPVTVLPCLLMCFPACCCAFLPVTVISCLLLCFPASYCASLPVTVLPCLLLPHSHLQFQLVSFHKMFTYSLPAVSFPPSGTVTAIVCDCSVLFSSPSVVTTIRSKWTG